MPTDLPCLGSWPWHFQWCQRARPQGWWSCPSGSSQRSAFSQPLTGSETGHNIVNQSSPPVSVTPYLLFGQRKKPTPPPPKKTYTHKNGSISFFWVFALLLITQDLKGWDISQAKTNLACSNLAVAVSNSLPTFTLLRMLPANCAPLCIMAKVEIMVSFIFTANLPDSQSQNVSHNSTVI